MKRNFVLLLLALLTCLFCSLSAAALEAYACYTPSNTTLTFYYDNLRSSRTGTTYDLNTGSNVPDWYTDASNMSVTQLVFDSSFAVARPTTTYLWFADMSNLTSITGLDYLNTSEVTDMYRMFYRCSSLTSLDLSNFNTAKVENMESMFQRCTSLGSLDVSSFNTAMVTNMNKMFLYCSSLTGLDVSSFNTANVTAMYQMFYRCTGLITLDLRNFNTSHVCDMGYMFSNCTALTTLYLSSFNTSQVTNIESMFAGCSNLVTIYVGSGWSTASVTASDSMFMYCSNIKGGKGTTYDAHHVDKAYAHIDGGASNPGYFTAEIQLGDVNGDGIINVADVTALIAAILNCTPQNPDLADLTGDDQINVADVTALIHIVLNQ